MDSEELCRAFLDALNQRSVEAVMAYFSPDAIADSPLYGRLLVKEFFEKLFSSPWYVAVRTLHVFVPLSFCSSIALHYLWRAKTASGEVCELECISVLELAVGRQQFAKLTNIHNPEEVREIAASHDRAMLNLHMTSYRLFEDSLAFADH